MGLLAYLKEQEEWQVEVVSEGLQYLVQKPPQQLAKRTRGKAKKEVKSAATGQDWEVLFWV